MSRGSRGQSLSQLHAAHTPQARLRQLWGSKVRPVGPGLQAALRPHGKLWSLLKQTGAPPHDLCQPPWPPRGPTSKHHHSDISMGTGEGRHSSVHGWWGPRDQGSARGPVTVLHEEHRPGSALMGGRRRRDPASLGVEGKRGAIAAAKRAAGGGPCCPQEGRGRGAIGRPHPSCSGTEQRRGTGPSPRRARLREPAGRLRALLSLPRADPTAPRSSRGRPERGKAAPVTEEETDEQAKGRLGPLPPQLTISHCCFRAEKRLALNRREGLCVHKGFGTV